MWKSWSLGVSGTSENPLHDCIIIERDTEGSPQHIRLTVSVPRVLSAQADRNTHYRKMAQEALTAIQEALSSSSELVISQGRGV